MCHTPAKLSLIIYPLTPDSAPALTLSHENKSPSSLFFVQTSPQPWAYGTQLWCCSFPHQIGSPCREETDRGRVFVFIYALVPTQEPGSQGTGEPPQLPASDPTLLPT